MDHTRLPIGRLIGGSVSHHVISELDIPSDTIAIGSTVVIEGIGGRHDYFATILDTGYTPPADKHLVSPPIQDILPVNLADRINRKINKTAIELMLTLCMDCQGSSAGQFLPVTSLPPLYSPVCQASEADIDRLFGGSRSGSWPVGFTREQGYPVSLNLAKLFTRSVGVFGASGSGKSAISRVIISGLIKKDIASVLVFDCHNDFSFDDMATDLNVVIPGLRSVFPDQVKVFGLGKNARVRGHAPDAYLEIGLTEILPKDILLLGAELDLRDTSQNTASALYKSFGQNWLREFLHMQIVDDMETENGKKAPPPGSVAYWAKRAGVNKLAANGLWAKLSRIRLPYVVDHPTPNGIQAILSTLQSGKSVILSFADHESDLDYALVSNLISRVLSEAWTNAAGIYRSTHENEPRRLVMVLEESHKFLGKDSESAFGRIAREMRKSSVTILVIDQRPSQIWDEVMSQIPTRICGWLGDDEDISAILTGLPGKDALKKIMSSLQQSGEMMIAGFATPMPMPFSLQFFTPEFVEKISRF
jgi:uncharacterized protein